MNFREQFNNSILFFDGAMGTELQKNGLGKGELPENLNIHSPEIVARVHKSYLDAGCNIISTNTFGANSLKFNNVNEIITKAVEIAKMFLLRYISIPSLIVSVTIFIINHSSFLLFTF